MKRAPVGRHGRVRGLGFISTLALLVLAPVPVFAHGGLRSSQPGRGEIVKTLVREIRLNLTETPELAVTSVRLTTERGAEIDLTRPTLVGNSVVIPLSRVLPDGRYNVAWNTAGRDGHPVSGNFSFEVASNTAASATIAPSAESVTVIQPMAPMEMHQDTLSLPSAVGFNAESPAYVAIRFVQFTALVILLGAFAFWHVVLRLLRRKDTRAPLLARTAKHHKRIAVGAATLLVVVGIVRLIAQSYAMHSANQSMIGPMMPMIVGTRWGIGWLLQMAGAILVIIGLRAVRNNENGWKIGTAGALALAFSPAFSGHAASSPHLPALAVLSDGLHVIGAGGWLGSLFFVAAVGIPAALTLEQDQKGDAVASLINVFSPTALLFAGLVAVTGIFAAWLHIGSIRALFETGYGQTLIVKLAILSLVAATGAYNWLYVRPKLTKPNGTVLLRRTVAVELMIALFVILVTAVLVATPTAIDEEMMKPAASAPPSGETHSPG